MHTALDTPWTATDATPALPARATGPVDATAAPTGPRTGSAHVLVTPWAASDVHLPAQATALPALALGAVLPQPRRVIDLRESAAVPT